MGSLKEGEGGTKNKKNYVSEKKRADRRKIESCQRRVYWWQKFERG